MRNNQARSFWSLVAEQRSGAVQYDAFDVRLDDGVLAARLSMGYRRSVDFDQSDGEGQDFAIVRACRDGYVVGLVADGVSQSFMGHLASVELGRELFEYLWAKRWAAPDALTTEQKLRRCERTLESSVSSFVVPEYVEENVRELIEGARTVGSQAVFTAFVLHAPTRQARVYEVGDARAIVLSRSAQGEPLVHAAVADPHGRFSSTGREELRLSSFDVTDVEAIVLKSDGAEGWGDDPTASLDAEAFAHVASGMAGKDDVSFVAVRIERVSDQVLVRPTRAHVGAAAPSRESSIAPAPQPMSKPLLPNPMLARPSGLGLTMWASTEFPAAGSLPPGPFVDARENPYRGHRPASRAARAARAVVRAIRAPTFLAGLALGLMFGTTAGYHLVSSASALGQRGSIWHTMADASHRLLTRQGPKSAAKGASTDSSKRDATKDSASAHDATMARRDH